MGYAYAFEVAFNEQIGMYYIRQIIGNQNIPYLASYTTNLKLARDMAIAYSGCRTKEEWEDMKARARA